MDSNQWDSLQHPSFDCISPSTYTNILLLNENELLMFDGASDYKGKQYALCKYNIKQNKWCKWLKYPQHLRTNYATGSLNHDGSKLYIFGEAGHVFKFDLRSGQVIKSIKPFHDGTHCRSLFINGEFHIFGGWMSLNAAHFIWNEEDQDLKRIHDFDEEIATEDLTLHSVMYLSSKNTVLIMPYISKSIYSYSLTTNECVQLELNVDKVSKAWAYAVLTGDKRYVILFSIDKSIYTLNLDTFDITKSKIICPFTNLGAVCIGNDNQNKVLVTFGYIRQCWKMSQFAEVRELPIDIIGIIKAYTLFETIYILDAKHETFWSINVDKLLSIV